MDVSSKDAIQALVSSSVKSYAEGFKARHEGELENPEGTLNMKIHNVFISELGPEVQYYTALVRSLDSSLGNMLEGLAISIAALFYEVKKNVEGPLALEQTSGIAELLEQYRRHEKAPDISDYQFLRHKPKVKTSNIRHDSDYYLQDKETEEHFLIELKIGGDLDNKKARSEKEAILEQYAILSNTLPSDASIKIFFATAYNRFGEEKPWLQARVLQFFAKEELLIGRDFWNFICKSENGYNWILEAYKKEAHYIRSALDEIKHMYLK